MVGSDFSGGSLNLPPLLSTSTGFNKNVIKNFLSNISLTVMLNVLVKPAWIFTEFWVHNHIGHESWGQYTALLSFSFLFITLSDLGINQYTTQKLASAPGLLQQYFPSLITTKVILSLLYPLLMMGLGWVWGYSGNEIYLLGLLALVFSGTQLKQFFRSHFQAMQRFRIDAYASVFERAVLLILAWALIFTYIDIERFIYARLLAVTLSILSFAWILFRAYGNMGMRLEIGKVRTFLRTSISFALITVLNSFLDKVDQVMLERMAGEHETSLYAAAYRWMDAIGMYLIITLTIFFARFARYIHDKEEQTRLLKDAQSITAIPIVFICAFVAFYGESFISLLFTNSNTAEVAVMTRALKILFMGVLLNGLLQTYSVLLSATGYIYFINRITIIAIMLNIVLNVFLIPVLGALGAAWTTVAALSLLGITNIVFVHYKLEVKVPWDILLKLIIAGGIISFIIYLFSLLTVSWWIAGLLSGIIFLVICVWLSIIPKAYLTFLQNFRK